MPTRSQRHLREIRGVDSGGRGPLTPSNAITAFAPVVASLAAVGAVGRTIAAIVPTGGTGPYTYQLTVAGGLSAAFDGNLLRTTVNPAGTVAVHNATVKVTDAWGKTFSSGLAVTLT